MTTTRELELLQRAEAAERAIIEAVRQRDMLLAACHEVVAKLGSKAPAEIISALLEA